MYNLIRCLHTNSKAIPIWSFVRIFINIEKDLWTFISIVFITLDMMKIYLISSGTYICCHISVVHTREGGRAVPSTLWSIFVETNFKKNCQKKKLIWQDGSPQPIFGKVIYANVSYWCTYTEHLMHEISDLMQGFTVSQVTYNMVYICVLYFLTILW